MARGQGDAFAVHVEREALAFGQIDANLRDIDPRQPPARCERHVQHETQRQQRAMGKSQGWQGDMRGIMPGLSSAPLLFPQ